MKPKILLISFILFVSVYSCKKDNKSESVNKDDNSSNITNDPFSLGNNTIVFDLNGQHFVMSENSINYYAMSNQGLGGSTSPDSIFLMPYWEISATEESQLNTKLKFIFRSVDALYNDYLYNPYKIYDSIFLLGDYRFMQQIVSTHPFEVGVNFTDSNEITRGSIGNQNDSSYFQILFSENFLGEDGYKYRKIKGKFRVKLYNDLVNDSIELKNGAFNLDYKFYY